MSEGQSLSKKAKAFAASGLLALGLAIGTGVSKGVGELNGSPETNLQSITSLADNLYNNSPNKLKLYLNFRQILNLLDKKFRLPNGYEAKIGASFFSDNKNFQKTWVDIDFNIGPNGTSIDSIESPDIFYSSTGGGEQPFDNLDSFLDTIPDPKNEIGNVLITITEPEKNIDNDLPLPISKKGFDNHPRSYTRTTKYGGGSLIYSNNSFGKTFDDEFDFESGSGGYAIGTHVGIFSNPTENYDDFYMVTTTDVNASPQPITKSEFEDIKDNLK